MPLKNQYFCFSDIIWITNREKLLEDKTLLKSFQFEKITLMGKEILNVCRKKMENMEIKGKSCEG